MFAEHRAAITKQLNLRFTGLIRTNQCVAMPCLPQLLRRMIVFRFVMMMVPFVNFEEIIVITKLPGKLDRTGLH